MILIVFNFHSPHKSARDAWSEIVGIIIDGNRTFKAADMGVSNGTVL